MSEEPEVRQEKSREDRARENFKWLKDNGFTYTTQKKTVTALYPGLLALAHREGLKAIRTRLIQVPDESNGHMAICTAEVETDYGVYAGIGDASPANVSRMIAPHIVRMSETRSKARALRDATNIGAVCRDELGEEEYDGQDSAMPHPIKQDQPPQRTVAPNNPSPIKEDPDKPTPTMITNILNKAREVRKIATGKDFAREQIQAWLDKTFTEKYGHGLEQATRTEIATAFNAMAEKVKEAQQKPLAKVTQQPAPVATDIAKSGLAQKRQEMTGPLVEKLLQATTTAHLNTWGKLFAAQVKMLRLDSEAEGQWYQDISLRPWLPPLETLPDYLALGLSDQPSFAELYGVQTTHIREAEYERTFNNGGEEVELAPF